MLFWILSVLIASSLIFNLLGILLRTIAAQERPSVTRRTASIFMKEWACTILMFVMWPFGWWNSPPEKSLSGRQFKRRAILLLPGYNLNRFTLLPLQWYLQRKGYMWVWAINRPFKGRCIEDFVDAAIQDLELLQRLSGISQIDIIGHSMGGLIAREIEQKIPQSVHSVLTLGTPWQGTMIHILGYPSHVHEMAPGKTLTTKSSGFTAPSLSLWSDEDWIVLPPTNAIHPKIPIKSIDAGHISLLLSAQSYQCIDDFLSNVTPVATTEHNTDQ